MADDKKYHATGKIYINAWLKLDSPLIIGCGENENADIDVTRDNKMEDSYQTKSVPIIPASSVIGVFRSLFNKTVKRELDSWDSKTDFPPLLNNFYEFFGYDENDQTKLPRYLRLNEEETEHFKSIKELTQSSFSIADIELQNAIITIRDGVKIDPRTNTAVDNAKFDYEIVETANSFKIVFEITKRHEAPADYEYYKSFIGYFLQGIDNGTIRFGAKTNKGFGVFKLDGDPGVADLNFKQPSHIWEWLNNTPHYTPTPITDLIKRQIDIQQKTFSISAQFYIKNSFLIKSYPTVPEEPDAVHIKSNGKPVLPGTSIMGAVRHRAWKIINTMFKDGNNKLAKFNDLFGYVHVNQYKENDAVNYPGFTKDQKKWEVAKGRVSVNECVIKNDKQSILEQVQTRIKIDRFTGGTIAGALFEEKALWQKDIEPVINIYLQIRDYSDWEAALFLFILKDLATGDLPIGSGKSIGRGVLIGKSAVISWDGQKSVMIEFDKEGFIKEREKNKLDEFTTFMTKWHNILEETIKVEGTTNE